MKIVLSLVAEKELGPVPQVLMEEAHDAVNLCSRHRGGPVV